MSPNFNTLQPNTIQNALKSNLDLEQNRAMYGNEQRIKIDENHSPYDIDRIKITEESNGPESSKTDVK